ncbi:MAG: hypothetical protein RR904_07355 [Bacilli bacterium]
MFNLFIFILLIPLLELVNMIMFSKRINAIGLKSYSNTICMFLSTVGIYRYLVKSSNFETDCKNFLNLLEKDTVYTTETHSMFVRYIEENHHIITKVKKRKKTLLLPKLFILNTNKLLKKYQLYKIEFKI